MIRVNRSIQELFIENNGIEGCGAKLIAEALMSNDCLETLWMVGNMLRMDVVAEFARAGSQNKALSCLGITCPKRAGRRQSASGRDPRTASLGSAGAHQA